MSQTMNIGPASRRVGAKEVWHETIQLMRRGWWVFAATFTILCVGYYVLIAATGAPVSNWNTTIARPVLYLNYGFTVIGPVPTALLIGAVVLVLGVAIECLGWSAWKLGPSSAPFAPAALSTTWKACLYAAAVFIVYQIMSNALQPTLSMLSLSRPGSSYLILGMLMMLIRNLIGFLFGIFLLFILCLLPFHRMGFFKRIVVSCTLLARFGLITATFLPPLLLIIWPDLLVLFTHVLLFLGASFEPLAEIRILILLFPLVIATKILGLALLIYTAFAFPRRVDPSLPERFDLDG